MDGSEGFDALTLCLFTGGAYADACCYPIPVRDIINIGIRVIKRCRLYAEEYKQWIAQNKANASTTPPVVEMFKSFKTFWSNKITLINQTSVLASLHGYSMMVTNNDESVLSYEESLANFGASYAATQESVKSHDTTITMMQSQLQAMQQYCMNLQQQPPPPSQYQQHHSRRGLDCHGCQQQAPTPAATTPCYTNPPLPYKHFENWNYCPSHGGDIDDGHTTDRAKSPDLPTIVMP